MIQRKTLLRAAVTSILIILSLLAIGHRARDRGTALTAALRAHGPVSVDDVSPADIVPHRATVTFEPGTSPEAATAAIASLGATVSHALPEVELYEAALPDGWSVAEGIAALVKLQRAVAAEPVVRYRTAFVPNDPLYTQYQQNYLELLHAQEAWDIQQGDPRTIVAVIDTGVDINHPDLMNQIWTNPHPGQGGCGNDIHGCNFADPQDIGDNDCSNVGYYPNPDVSPDFYHGTFVAGIIAASINNSMGIAGIAPRASIMPIKAFDCDGRGTATGIAQAVQYAVNNGARVINLSSGGESFCRVLPLGLFQVITQAIQAGVNVIAAAGNDNEGCVEAPANTPGVIAVSAIGQTGDTKASFSNWGIGVTVAAPGVGIVSTTSGPTPSFSNSTQHTLPPPNNQYRMDTGTSFSAPIVAGLAALLISQNPYLTSDMVRSIIQRGAVHLSPGSTAGWAGAGRVDLAASLRLVPASYQGRVLLGRAVPDGTPVEARIGTTVCGSTTTSTSAGQSVYALFVSTAADVSGCGADGAQVSFAIGGSMVSTVPWKQSAQQLDLGQAAASAAPSGGSSAVLYHSGWNIVAGPAGTVFSAASGSLYTLQPGDTGYESQDAHTEVKAGFGYWAFFPADATVPLAPDGPETYTVTLPPGAVVLVGNPSGSRAVTVSGADSVLAFDPARATYSETPTLQPGQGAWVTSAAGGVVTLQ